MGTVAVVLAGILIPSRCEVLFKFIVKCQVYCELFGSGSGSVEVKSYFHIFFSIIGRKFFHSSAAANQSNNAYPKHTQNLAAKKLPCKTELLADFNTLPRHGHQVQLCELGPDQA